jgi:hypothetical protein
VQYFHAVAFGDTLAQYLTSYQTAVLLTMMWVERQCHMDCNNSKAHQLKKEIPGTFSGSSNFCTHHASNEAVVTIS